MLFGFFVLGASYLLAMRFLPWTAFQQEILAAVGVLLLGVAAFWRSDERRWPMVAVGVAIYALVPLAQAAAGLLVYPADGILATMYVWAFALSIVAGTQLMAYRRDEFLDGLAGTLLCVALVSSGLAMTQWLQLELPVPEIWYRTWTPGDRPGANMAQPNHLGTLLLLGLISAALLFQRGAMRGGFLAVCAGILCLGMVSTQSRSLWISVPCLFVWTAFVHRRSGLAISPRAVAAFGVAFAALSLFWAPMSAAMGYESGRQFVSPAHSGRLVLWAYVVEALKHSPWVGYGWGEVMVAFTSVATRMPAVAEMSEYSHNLLLDLLLWNGLPLGIIAIAGLAWWAMRSIRTCQDSRAALLLAALGAIAVHAMFEFPHAYAYFLLPAGLMMGAVDGLRPSSSGWRMPKVVHGVLIFGVFGVATLIAVDYMRIDADHRRMRLEYMGLSAPTPPTQTVNVHLLHHLRALIMAAREPMHEGMSVATLDKLKRAATRFPHPAILMRHAISSAVNGRPDDARDAMDRLCKLHTVKSCEEGKAQWRMIAKDYPEMAGITLP